MAAFEVKCSTCGMTYKLLQRPSRRRFTCKKCGSTIEVQPAAAERADRSGQSFGGYVLVRLLARGERSDVYEAHQVAMKRTVAVEVLGDEYVSDQAAAREFAANARLVAAMRHPNIVSIYDVNEKRVPYFSMEYVEGSSARDLLNTAGLPPVAEAVRATIAVGSALTHALRNNVKSFAVTPDTVMLSSKGEVKILPAALCTSGDDDPETRQGRSVMTLGAFLYTLLTGVQPDPKAKTIEAPSVHNGEVSELLDKTVLQMLRGERGFSSLASATQALKHLTDRKRNIDRRVETTFKHIQRRKTVRSRKSIVVAVALCVACAGVLAGMAWYLLRQKDMGERLTRIHRLAKADEHAAFVAAAEEFINEYPSHEDIGELKKRVESHKAKAHAAKRLEQARDAIAAVNNAALKAPHLVSTYHDRLDDVAKSFSDVDGIDRLVKANKIAVRRIWENQLDIYRQEIQSTANRHRYAEAYEKMEELERLYAEPGSPDSAEGKALVGRLRERLDSFLNVKFASINSKAFDFQQQGDTDEAIQLYQDVIDNWGLEKWAEEARKGIERLRRMGRGPEGDGNEAQPEQDAEEPVLEKEENNGN